MPLLDSEVIEIPNHQPAPHAFRNGVALANLDLLEPGKHEELLIEKESEAHAKSYLVHYLSGIALLLGQKRIIEALTPIHIHRPPCGSASGQTGRGSFHYRLASLFCNRTLRRAESLSYHKDK